ncbi:MAG: lipoyl(octanoyl) transferase LipB [Thermoguttaceae bacterium]|jgi:lipoyl(octanoyl) transferase
MPYGPLSAESQSPAVETFLLGQIPYLRCLEFQQRLLDQVSNRADGQIVVLMCEHPPVITIGRGGRPSQVASGNRLLRSGQIETHWTNRGGGCLVHCPGQLAIYPILPLCWHDFSLGEYLERFQAALAETLTELGVQVQPQPGRYGVWGRTGQIAALGVAVRNWVTWHGAYLNVSPALGLFRLVESDPLSHMPMGSIAAERCGVVRMATVRAVLVRRLTEAFGCDRYHLYTGHPWLKSQAE